MNEQTMHDWLTIDAKEQRMRKTNVGFGPKDIEALTELAVMVRNHVDRIVDSFCDNLDRFPDARTLIDNLDDNIETFRENQRHYLLDFVSGEYGDEYFKRRCQIGAAHADQKLTPRWFQGAQSFYLQALIPLISSKYRFRPGKLNTALIALNKLILLDQQVVSDAYINGLTAEHHKAKLYTELKVEQYVDFIHYVATGLLTERLDSSDDGTLSVLGDRLNEMVERLAAMTRQMKSSSENTIATLNDLREGIAQQTQGAAQQATAVNETTVTLSQIKATSSQTMEKAKRLGEISERSRDESEQGIDSMQQSIHGMVMIKEKVQGIAQTIMALSQQTQQIGEITEVVTGLAQQLKMLALNASIEAAKAGEAGKGFGVVAAEVKELAEQSQQSTAQVQKILHDIRHATDRAVMATEEGDKGVEEGTRLMEQTGQTVNKLFNVIKETHLASQQIVAAVGQEVAGIQQVSSSMNQINDITGQFADSSKNTYAAMEKLQEMAQQMANSIDVYKL